MRRSIYSRTSLRTFAAAIAAVDKKSEWRHSDEAIAAAAVAADDDDAHSWRHI